MIHSILYCPECGYHLKINMIDDTRCPECVHGKLAIAHGSKKDLKDFQKELINLGGKQINIKE